MKNFLMRSLLPFRRAAHLWNNLNGFSVFDCYISIMVYASVTYIIACIRYCRHKRGWKGTPLALNTKMVWRSMLINPVNKALTTLCWVLLDTHILGFPRRRHDRNWKSEEAFSRNSPLSLGIFLRVWAKNRYLVAGRWCTVLQWAR